MQRENKDDRWQRDAVRRGGSAVQRDGSAARRQRSSGAKGSCHSCTPKRREFLAHFSSIFLREMRKAPGGGK